MSYEEYNDIPPERKKELNRKIAETRQGFSLPPEISFTKTALKDDFHAYVFRHQELGELGRITITRRFDGQSQVNCEVVGNEDDPMTAKRKEIFEPVAKDVLKRMAGVLG